MKPDGRYSRTLEDELREYLNEPKRDEWDVDTAAETPQALRAKHAPPKRSGEYVRADIAGEIAALKRICYK